MSDFRYIFQRADKLLQQKLKKELRDQGHFNTGALESSFASNVTANGYDTELRGRAANYAGILNEGVKAEAASMKQFYFVKQFFISKGYDPKLAGTYAAMTIRKWMKEGMSTKASKRFSKNGRRTNFIGIVQATISERINKVVLADIDKEMQKLIHKTKSITI